jgi:hypothetical protein
VIDNTFEFDDDDDDDDDVDDVPVDEGGACDVADVAGRFFVYVVTNFDEIFLGNNEHF